MFQSFNLLGALTAEQNVALPARLAGNRLTRRWSAVRSSASGWATASGTDRRSSRAVSSSAWRSPAPSSGSPT